MMYLRLMISMLFSHVVASDLTCDYIDIDLYAHGNMKTHTCDCHICYDTETNIRVTVSSADTINLGKSWHKLKLINHDPKLDLFTVLSSEECPYNRNYGSVDSDDIVIMTSLLRSLTFQDKLCRRAS